MKEIKKSNRSEEIIDAKMGRKVSKIISNMHLAISVKSDVESPHNRGSYITRYYREIIATPGPSKDKEFGDKYFIMFRDILSNSLRVEHSEKKLLEIDSFITLAVPWDSSTGYTREKLKLKEYLDIIETNESFIEYVSDLVKYCKAKKWNCHVVFDEIDLDEFCSKKFYFKLKNLGYVIDIKKIEYKDKYLYSRPKLFKDIETSWRNGMYDKAIDESETSLDEFVDKYEKERGRRGLNVRKKYNPKKFEDNEAVFKSFFDNVCSDYQIEGLTENLDEILIQFNKLRNKFKGKPNYSLDNQKVPKIIKKINVRLTIDLAKTAHNILVTLASEKEKFD